MSYDGHVTTAEQFRNYLWMAAADIFWNHYRLSYGHFWHLQSSLHHMRKVNA